VILADGKEQEPGLRAARFRAFGRFVESLGGRYITAPDVGTTSADMATIKGVTGHVAGYPVEMGGRGDPAPMTAFGVLQGMRALAEEVLGIRGLLKVRVAIQGLGSVGMNLAKLLVAEGAVVIGTDIRPEVVRQASMDLPMEVVAPEAIYEVPAAIFAPCALGGVLNVAQEQEGYDYQKARQKVAHIYETVKRMLAISQAEQISTLAA
jgi:leucine dehydrogenase